MTFEAKVKDQGLKLFLAGNGLFSCKIARENDLHQNYYCPISLFDPHGVKIQDQKYSLAGNGLLSCKIAQENDLRQKFYCPSSRF